MKTCTTCGAPLPTSLAEFGPAGAPLCLACFLDPRDPLMDGDLLEDATREMANIRSDLIDQENMIASIECHEHDFKISHADFHRQLDADHRQLSRLRDQYNGALDQIERIKEWAEKRKQTEQQKLAAWISGE